MIAERLAAACWHDHERIGATRDGGDYFLLRVEKLAEAKIFFEDLVGGHVDYDFGEFEGTAQVRATNAVIPSEAKRSRGTPKCNRDAGEVPKIRGRGFALRDVDRRFAGSLDCAPLRSG